MRQHYFVYSSSLVLLERTVILSLTGVSHPFILNKFINIISLLGVSTDKGTKKDDGFNWTWRINLHQ
jgi:hypothetical protein